MPKNILSITILLIALPTMWIGCANSTEDLSNIDAEYEMSDIAGQEESDSEDILEHIHEEHGVESIDTGLQLYGCNKATTSQMKPVDLGLSKKEKFLLQCSSKTGNSSWCSQLVRPNPSSYNTFSCTYGSDQEHVLINPDETTWKYPIEGVNIIKDLQKKGISVSLIYNWWRPEPYNKNVGGAAGRHPYGTSIDVRFSSNSMANVAFNELCKMRKAGRLRAIGHYGSASLHIGVGDRTANTWGKTCN